MNIPDTVVRRYAAKNALSEVESRMLFAELEHFLDVAAAGDAKPSPHVDRAWHEFILDTSQYSAFCNARYGRYLHHVPAEIDGTPGATCACRAPD